MYIKLSWERRVRVRALIYLYLPINNCVLCLSSATVESDLSYIIVQLCMYDDAKRVTCCLWPHIHIHTQDSTRLDVYVLLQIDTGIQVCVPWSYYINIDWLLFINKRGWLIHIHYPRGCYIITTKLWSNIPFPITWRRSFPPPMHEEIAFSIMCFWQVQCLSMCLRECVCIVVYRYTILMYL